MVGQFCVRLTCVELNNGFRRRSSYGFSGVAEPPHCITRALFYAVFKKRCYLAVLDAKRVGRDDVVLVKMEVPEHLTFPLGFHGFWVDKESQIH
ncbi:hypothetical protein KSP40_PGU016370 [Platanthera guangdongensis]|uniref:Uncharacterized protein n=1 Tax=Platanthera guangdongensis TaxID=2320717 RepID=A0ABR2LMU0_9ASPA